VWHYSVPQRFQQPLQSPLPGPQSTLDVLLGMRGMAVTLLCLDTEGLPPSSPAMPGFLEEVTASGLTIGVAAPLHSSERSVHFGVEVLAGSGILRFFAQARQPVAAGETRVSLVIPRQIETVQRRKFSRIRSAFPVVFAPAEALSPSGVQPSGQGHALDLSAGGLRLTSSQPLREGLLLFLSFLAPDGTSFRGLEGKVARVQPDGPRTVAVVQFTNLTPDMESGLVQTVFRLQLGSPAKR